MLSRRLSGISVLALLVVVACSPARLFVADSGKAWQDTAAPSPADEVHRVILLGDPGAVPTDGSSPVLRALRYQLQDIGDRATIVLLGDNLYCCGLPDSASPDRADAETRLRDILTSVSHSGARVIVIPGNHDWNHSSPGGLEAIRRQERFVEDFLGSGDSFLPSDGFPGPAKVRLTDNITLLAIDTEWYLTDESKSFGDDGTTEIRERDDMILALAEEVQREDDQHLIVVAHHPLLSNGKHSGAAPAREHLFPLTALWGNAYVPLPVLGTMSVLYRRYLGGNEQDMAHSRNRHMREALLRAIMPHDKLVYASGHDHSLQYFRTGSGQNPNHLVVSGAGSKASFAAAGGDAIFAGGGLGYASLHYYTDGSSWLSFWGADDASASPRLLFRTLLVSGALNPALRRETDVDGSEAEYPDYSDSVAVRAANPSYAAGPLKSFFMGSHNRDVWTEPVEAPYLDMRRFAGGLTPLKRGGGMQTTSLRLQGQDGKQYVLRTLDKDPSKSLPPSLRQTVALDILQDQITSINPYGAYVIPKLAEAAGIYHTRPQLVFVPRDRRLGRFIDTFADQLMMIEDRPDDDMSDVARYGFSGKVVSASRMHREINDDNDNSVDQEAYVRARLLDMLVSDWDRHRGQWRWASFEKPDGKGRLFRPIPRDRDWAFNRVNGLFPPLIRLFEPKFQDFRRTYGNLRGLNSSGLEQDRRFTSTLPLRDWLTQARHIVAALSDSVIDAAVADLPEAIVPIKGPEMADKLKHRRDNLERVAADYFRLITRVVDIVGSNKHERFEVESAGEGRTRVVVYKTKKDGAVRKELYRREFDGSETNEIRLYCLSGNDRFAISGTGGGLTVRCIGGPGVDSFESDDLALNVIVHDMPDGNTVKVGRETDLRVSDDPWLNTYDPREFRYNVVLPVASFGANSDDGVFLGGGARIVRHGYKKGPYASTNIFTANFAAATAAFNVDYRGHFVGALKGLNVELGASVASPNNIRNFHGLGNESENSVEDREFYQARLSQVTLTGYLKHESDDMEISVGPTLRITDVRQDPDRFQVIPQPGLSSTTFDDQWFAGVHTAAVLSNTDRPQNPRRGFSWSNSADVYLGIRNSSSNYAKLTTDLTVIGSPSISPQVTLAVRAGVEHTLGSFPFWAASTLGGGSNLRGYRGTRFAGRTAFFQNFEVRTRLFRYSTYLAVGEAGILGFLDNGRVWTDGESSSKWHQGYGGGFWTTIFGRATLATWVGTSSEEVNFTLKLGFQY